jgi:hypothetical protein
MTPSARSADPVKALTYHGAKRVKVQEKEKGEECRKVVLIP